MGFKSIIFFSLFLLNLSDDSSSVNTYELIIFEGSDWCPNCRKLDSTILSVSSFETFLENNNTIIKKVDFPQRKKQSKQVKEDNVKLAEQYGFSGKFPTIVVVNKKENSYNTLSYASTMTQQELESQILSFVKKVKN